MHSGSGRKAPAGKPMVLQMICSAIAAILVLVVVAVVVVWASVNPHKPKYYLNSVDVSRLDVDPGSSVVDTRLSAKLTARNPNRHVGIYYDEILAFLLYGYQEIGWGSLQPFYQTHKNTTELTLTLSGWQLRLPHDEAQDLYKEKVAGVLDDVHLVLHARVRFKVGRWKSGHYDVRIKCRHLAVHPVGTSSLHNKKCHVHV